MAKLYINKDIVADKDKMENWYLTGDEGLSFPDIQYFLSWLDPADPKIDIEIHSCGGDTVEGYAIYDALRASGKEISCTVVGRCASMACRCRRSPTACISPTSPTWGAISRSIRVNLPPSTATPRNKPPRRAAFVLTRCAGRVSNPSCSK